MSWYDGHLALMDTETTGVDVFNDRIVTACVILVPPRPPEGGSRLPKVYEWMADPGIEIPAGASAVHGITTERAREHGKPAPEVIEQFTSMLATFMGQGVPVVTMNGGYDLSLLHHESERHGIKTLGDRLPNGVRPVVDVFILDKELDRRKGKRNLGALCEYYRVEIGQNAHDSTVDALAAGRVAWAICKKYPKIAEMKLDDLHDEQVRWRAKQQKSFASWLRGEAAKETDPQKRQETLARAEDCRPEWPVIPRPAAAPEPEPVPEPLW
jgi:DNA polymerase-3 subunit epsilon